jgi:uroporphyrinogen-III synthase
MSDTPSPSSESATTPPPRIDPIPPKSLPPGGAKKPSRPAIRVPATASLIVLLIVALALVGTSPYWAPPLMPLLPWNVAQAPQERPSPAQDQTAQQLAAIQQQLEQLTSLNNRVTALENRPAPDASAVVAPLAAQVKQLDARIDQIDKLMAQLTRDAANNAESPQRVLMISLASLGNAIATSRPFSAELASVEAQAQNRKSWAAALQPLEAPAKTGIPSAAVLTQRFSDDVAPAILRADAGAPNSQQSMAESMWARLRSLVIIRRVDGDDGSGNPTDQAVNEAQAALDKSDLAGAVTALGTLKGAAAKAAQPWLKAAQQRVDAEQTVAKLSQDLAADMAAGASGG